ncbi:hypothetical protein DAI22_01g381800 [Oryza sativa Japonica Group]|nr:hypothetical protein DAI22_01g381800 [Oryza sativa Japonica Group]
MCKGREYYPPVASNVLGCLLYDYILLDQSCCPGLLCRIADRLGAFQLLPGD